MDTIYLYIERSRRRVYKCTVLVHDATKTPGEFVKSAHSFGHLEPEGVSEYAVSSIRLAL